VKYVGLPLRYSALTKDDWLPVINKIEKKVRGWMSKLLSLGGRLVLINSVLSQIPISFLPYFWAPVWFIKRVDKIRRAFLWRGKKDIVGGLCLVSWKQVCKQKKQGGLGIRDLRDFNIALLSKWWWRLFNGKNIIWRNLVLEELYRRRQPLHEHSTPSTASAFWKGILKAKNAFRGCIQYRRIK
jgi:hypothetical protein